MAIALIATSTALTANASTSRTVVHRADGTAAAVVRFNSGDHAAHHTPPETAFNAFIMEDLVCGDGWGVGVTWRLSDGSSIQRGPADCGAEVVHPTGQAGSVILEFQWRPYLWKQIGDGELREHGEWQQDWMGSNSINPNDRWFSRSTVYRDTLKNHTQQTFTISMWPTALTRRTDVLFLKEKWNEVQKRTPLPPSLTKYQRDSLFQQLWCHARFAKTRGVGGSTWDLESARPVIEQWRVSAEIWKHECNW